MSLFFYFCKTRAALMKILLKNATLLDPSSPFHCTIQDVLILENKIVAIAPDIEEDDAKTIKNKKTGSERNLCIFSFSNFSE